MRGVMRAVSAWRWRYTALAVLLTTGCQRGGGEFAVEPLRPAPPLEASRASGGVFRLSELRGKVVLLSFGYLTCPDVCPTTLSRLRALHERLGPVARDLEVVFISVDPERDGAQALESYVRAFHPSFSGLRLEGPALEAVLSAYGVTVLRRYSEATRYRDRPFSGELPYTLDHTGVSFVIDRHGRLRLKLPYTLTSEQMRAELLPLLAEEPEA